MDPFFWVVCFWVDVLGLGQAPQPLFGRHQIERVNHSIQGQVLDFTRNHGHDNRVWSPALGQRRDLYVYLPPGFDSNKRYPLAILLHGAGQDERFFIQAQASAFDRAIREGRLPPLIVAVPDGTIRGTVGLFRPATFWANSRVGAFEDYVMCDVWNFMHQHFPILPEREAHALMGASMGGSASMALSIKHRDRVGVVMSIMPLLNIRHVDHGRYRTPFDPATSTLRERFRGFEALGHRKIVTLQFGQLFAPLFGRGQRGIAGMSRINPLELMERENLQNGELQIYIAYGDHDEFNVSAQVEGFVHAAQARGIALTVDVDPGGRHNVSTARRLMPNAMRWASERVPLAR